MAKYRRKGIGQEVEAEECKYHFNVHCVTGVYCMAKDDFDELYEPVAAEKASGDIKFHVLKLVKGGYEELTIEGLANFHRYVQSAKNIFGDRSLIFFSHASEKENTITVTQV